MEIQMTKQAKIKQWIVIALLAVMAIILPFTLSKAYYVHVLIMCLMWAYLATAWNILGGFAGQLSLGHGVYVAAGAYISTMLFNTFGISPWIGMFVGAAGAIIIACMIGLPTFNLRGAYFALATVAISEGVVVILENLRSVNIGALTIKMGGAEGLSVSNMGVAPLFFQWNTKQPYYFTILIMLIVILLVSWYIKRSKLGFQLAALKDDEDAAKALGINVRNAKLKAAIISAFFTAIGGVFYAMLIRYLEPSAVAGSASMSNQMVFLAIVGGSATVFGPAIGGFLLTLISTALQFFLGGSVQGLHLFIYGLIVLLVIMFKPEGIIGILEKWYFKFLGVVVSEGLKGGGDENAEHSIGD